MTAEATLVSGFKVDLLSFFGKDTVSNLALKDTRVMPEIQEPDAWDSGNGYTGTRRVFKSGIKRVTNNKLLMVQSILKGPALI